MDTRDDTTTVTDQTCPSVGYQSVTISVPVTVTPFAKAGATQTKCCGAATVTAGRNLDSGVKNGSCVFTISQDVCISVPVDFGATAAAEEAYTTCNGVSAENICADCSLSVSGSEDNMTKTTETTKTTTTTTTTAG
jgi:hypothetical protein